MYLKILTHPVFVNLNFHMPMIVDLSHPLIMLQGENGSGKSTLLHSIYYALRGEKPEGYVYRLDRGEADFERPLVDLLLHVGEQVGLIEVGILALVDRGVVGEAAGERSQGRAG